MSNFIGPESKIYEAMSWFSELVVINFLLIITSIPVVTAGSSLRAGHKVIGAMVKDGSPAKARLFISALPEKFFPTTLVWVGSLGLVALAAYESWVIHNAGLGWVGMGFRAALLSALLLLGMISIWFLHLDGHQSQKKLGESLVAAITHAIRFLPLSLFALAPWLLLIVVPFVIPNILGAYVFFFLVIGPALAVYLSELALQWPEIKDPNTPVDGNVEV